MADAAMAQGAIAAALALGREVMAAAARGDHAAAARLHAAREEHLRIADEAFGPGDDEAWRDAIWDADDHEVRWLTDAVITMGSWSRFADLVASSTFAEESERDALVLRMQGELVAAKRAAAQVLAARKAAMASAARDAAAARELAAPAGDAARTGASAEASDVRRAIERARASLDAARAASTAYHECIARIVRDDALMRTIAGRSYKLVCRRGRPRTRRLYASSSSLARPMDAELTARRAKADAEIEAIAASLPVG